MENKYVVTSQTIGIYSCRNALYNRFTLRRHLKKTWHQIAHFAALVLVTFAAFGARSPVSVWQKRMELAASDQNHALRWSCSGSMGDIGWEISKVSCGFQHLSLSLLGKALHYLCILLHLHLLPPPGGCCPGIKVQYSGTPSHSIATNLERNELNELRWNLQSLSKLWATSSGLVPKVLRQKRSALCRTT